MKTLIFLLQSPDLIFKRDVRRIIFSYFALQFQYFGGKCYNLFLVGKLYFLFLMVNFWRWFHHLPPMEMPNVPGVRRRPQKYQETWRAVSGVRTSRLLCHMRFSIGREGPEAKEDTDVCACLYYGKECVCNEIASKEPADGQK